MSFPHPFDPYQSFELPKDAERLKALYWTPPQAARAWRCSRATAYRLIDRYEKELQARLIWVLRGEKLEIWRVIRAGSERPEQPKGNPAFRDGNWQSQNARAREARKRAAREGREV